MTATPLTDEQLAEAVAQYQDLNRAGRRAVEKTGGFPARRIVNLDFEDTKYDGLQVRIMSISYGQQMDLAMTGVINNMRDAELQVTPEQMKLIDKLHELLVGALVEWNLEDIGIDPETKEVTRTPTPMTIEGLKSADAVLVLDLVQTWMRGMTQISGPLAQRSSNGETLAVPSLPMEPLSPDR